MRSHGLGSFGRAATLRGASENPLLSRAVLLLRAATFTGSTGDDWPNEGTGGSALDAQCNNTVDGIDAGTPVFVTSPVPGFELADSSSGTPGSGPYYSVPHSALLEPGLESFTAFAWVTWDGDTGGAEFANIMSKIDSSGGAMGSGGTGWQVVDSPFTGGTTLLVSDGGAPGSGTAWSWSGATLTTGTYLIAVRLDRTDDTAHVFVDGVKSNAGDMSSVGAITAAHELIFGRGDHPQVGHAYGYFAEALTDTEITDLLPGLAAAA